MDRFTWGVVVGVLALIALGIGVAAVLPNAKPPDLSTPSGVALAFELAVQEGRGEDAWALLASEAKVESRKQRFLDRVNPGRSSRNRISADREEITGDSARVELTRYFGASGGLFGGSGSRTTASVRLTREAGSWRVSTPSDSFLLRD
jgi:hypothetical protein